jgi:hypothetical protein
MLPGVGGVSAGAVQPPQLGLTPSLVMPVAEEQRYKRQSPTLAEEEQLEARDEGLGTLLDRLGGSIRGTQVDILPKQVIHTTDLKGCQLRVFAASAPTNKKIPSARSS